MSSYRRLTTYKFTTSDISRNMATNWCISASSSYWPNCPKVMSGAETTVIIPSNTCSKTRPGGHHLAFFTTGDASRAFFAADANQAMTSASRTYAMPR